MSFALPSAFLLSLLAIPIIVFYILKVRLRRVPVSTNMFWSQIYDEKPPRSIWQYFKHLLSLLLQLLFLLLLVLALTDPYFPWQLQQARRVALVIDNSASMQVLDADGKSRFETAIDRALGLVDSLRFRDEMTIILAGARPEVVLGMSGHAPTLKRTLKSLKISDNPTSIDRAIELGKQLIGEHLNGEIVVLTDGCLPQTSFEQVANESQTASSAEEGSEKSSPRHEPKIHYQIVGTESANVGITQFQVRRSLIDPMGYEILVSVFNASDAPVNCRLELELNGLPVDILPLELKPEEKWSRSLEKTSIEGGHLTAVLTQIKTPSNQTESTDRAVHETDLASSLNGLESDDRAWAVLPSREIQKVLIVTPGNLFLQKVFEANPLVQITLLEHFPEEWPTDAIVVLHGDVPPTLPPGDLFVIDPATSTDDWELGPALDDPIVTDMKSDSPLMTHVRLDNVLVPEAKKIEFKTDSVALASTLSGDPIYAQLQRESGRVLVLNVNLERSDLAFRTTFPIMVTNSLGWFAGESGELRPSLPTGKSTALTLDRKSIPGDTLALTSPAGTSLPIALPILNENTSDSLVDTTTTLSVGPFPNTGIWSVNSADQERSENDSIAEIAVNLANERETDLRPLDELVEQNELTTTLAGTISRPFWFYLIATACVLTSLEWFLYQRRIVT